MRKKTVDTRRTASERRAARKKQHEPRDPTGQTDDEGHQSIRWHIEEQMDLLIQQLEQAREECKELQGKHARTKKKKRKRKKGCREDASEVSNSDARDEMEKIELLNEVNSVDYGKAEMSKARKQHFWEQMSGSANFKPLLESNGRDWKKFSKHTPPKQWEPGPRLHRGVLPTRTTGSTHMKIAGSLGGRLGGHFGRPGTSPRGQYVLLQEMRQT